MVKAWGWTGWLLVLSVFSAWAEPPIGSAVSARAVQVAGNKSVENKVVENKVVADKASYAKAMANSPAMLTRDAVQAVWRVFFATNRLRLAGEADRPVSYGPVPASPPRLDFGECQVVIPARQVSSGTAAAGKSVRTAGPIAVPTGAKVICRNVQTTAYNRFLDDLAGVVAKSPQHDVLVFVHGDNVRFEEATCRAGELALDLPFNGAVLCYSWPSAGSTAPSSTSTSTISATNADGTVRHLWRFLAALQSRLGSGTRINVVAEGLGCRVLMQGVAAIPENIRQTRPFQHMVLVAPDIDPAEFQRLAEKCAAASRHVTRYVAQGAGATPAAKKPARQSEPADGGLNGAVSPHMDTVDVTLIGGSFLRDAYRADNRTIWDELFQLIKLDKKPGQRSSLKASGAVGKRYWQVVPPRM